jgi:uncharacterized protein
MNTTTATPQPDETARGGVPVELGVGAIGGVIGGLFGGGSGVFFVPTLEHLTSLPRPTLHGTATTANIGVVGVGTATFALVGGTIDLHAGLGMLVGGTLGGLFGAALILKFSPTVLRWLFVAVLLATVLKLTVDIIGTDPLAGGAAFPLAVLGDPWYVIPVSLALGFVIGAWAAGMGLGGGLLAVPVLMVMFGTNLHTAVGTSLLMFFPNSIVGAIMHFRQGTAAKRLSLTLNLGTVPGAIGGSLLALALNATLLSIVYAAFSLFVAVRELYRMYDAKRRASAAGAPTPLGEDVEDGVGLPGE